MRLIQFDYALHRGLRVPIIPVLIQWDNKWFKVWAYVDSGAAYSIFSNDVATQIGIDTLPESRLMVVVADGSYIPVSFYTLKLKIGEEEITAQVGFSERLGVGFNLLGRKGIFETFKVCFDEGANVITFEKKY